MTLKEHDLGTKSPYANGEFLLSVEFDKNLYPYKAPNIKFITKIFHPNIDDDGQIQLGMLHQSFETNKVRMKQ